MDNMDSAIREELIASDAHFRELARKHGRFEARLEELAALAHPNEEEQLEEVTLKKQKLHVKDQMYDLIRRHQPTNH